MVARTVSGLKALFFQPTLRTPTPGFFKKVEFKNEGDLDMRDDERRAFVEKHKYHFVLLSDSYGGEGYQYYGAIKPNDRQTFHLKVNGQEEPKRIHYHDIVSLFLDTDVRNHLRF